MKVPWWLRSCLFQDAFLQMCASDDRIRFLVAAWLISAIPGNEDRVFKYADLQYVVFSAGGRKLVLDAWAVDMEGNVYNLEIQSDRKGAAYARLDAHESVLLSASFHRGAKFRNAPVVHVYCVTPEDLYPDVPGPVTRLYRVPGEYTPGVSRGVPGSVEGRPVAERSVIAYVDGSYRGNDRLGHMLHDLSCSDPAQMRNDTIRQIVEYTRNPALKEAKRALEAAWRQQIDSIQEKYQRRMEEIEAESRRLKTESRRLKTESRRLKTESRRLEAESRRLETEVQQKHTELVEKDTELAEKDTALVSGLELVVKSTGMSPEMAVQKYDMSDEKRAQLVKRYYERNR